MQIWKSTNIFVFIWKYYVEDFTLKHLFFLSESEICEEFALLFEKAWKSGGLQLSL